MPTYNEFEEKLEDISDKVKKYNLHINESGIWFFLAILGCWGINDDKSKIIAVFASILIFTHKLLSGLDGFKPYLYELRELEKQIEISDINKVVKESLRLKIIKFRTRELGFSRIFLNVPAYYISGIFLIFSVAIWGDFTV